ncbi:major facilitator superfamily domain-containing protein [Trichoderma longibrachiatum]|uniref:MFS general substrate transporter n=1 Tax=Trichoderma longibrachiatum ATCC 18648 TaxID=983965 RepID=A0A2T4BSS5_TRILO|nr:MFS general substrate transporter [Trichoderma longibrachiatum ATCC 18648]
MRFFKTTTDTAQEPEVEVDLAGKAGHVEKNPLPVHNEDAVHRPSIDRQLERRVVRKLDMNLVPLVMALYLLAFLDRSNIGNARIAGMSDDLNLIGDRYDWLLTIFYIPYIVFEFLGIMWKVVPPHIWATFVVFLWGLVSTLQAVIQSWGGEMALRFVMGAAEAAYGPGIPFLLSFFYLRHELGSRCGVFLSAAPLANTFAGALAYGITSGHPSIAKWRVLFLVEGLPTIVMAAVAFFYLPDSPEKAKFLDEDEKRVAMARSVRQAGTSRRIGGVDWKDFGRGLIDIKAWFTGLMYFSCNVSFASLPVFLPTILSEMGFSDVTAQGLTAPPFFLSFLVTLVTPYIADRTQQRGLMLIFLTIIGGVGYVILATAKSVGARYFGVFMAAGGIFPSIANILPWVLNNQGSDTRRGAGIVLLNVIGQCGPLLGTRLYPSNEGPFYVKGQSICAAFMFFTTLLVIGLRTLLVWENKQLDKKYGTIEQQKTRLTEAEGRGEEADQVVAVENYGPMFRYVL